MTGQKLYYAHAMLLYGTEDEEREIGYIKNAFPDHELVNPRFYQNNSKGNDMDYYKDLVSTTNTVVFSKLEGHITSGVGQEVNHALSLGIPVLELRDNGNLAETEKPVEHLSHGETNKLFDKLRGFA